MSVNLEYIQEFPRIVRVELARDLAEEGAARWRDQGFTAVVHRRALRVMGLAAEIHVVVLPGRKKR